MVTALVEEAKRLVEEGVEARLAAADKDAAAMAEADRGELLQTQGDANRVEIKRKAVAETAKG
jgi:predicted transcriptional regulator